VQDIAHLTPAKTAGGVYAQAKKFEQKRGLTMLNATPFYDTDTFTVLTSYAKAHGLKTIGDMKKVGSFSYAGYPECQTRITCLLGLKQIYGLKQVKFVPLSSISVYTLLDQGKATGGDGFSTDPQQLSGKYTVLTDTKHIFGFQNVAPIISKKTLAAGGSTLSSVINAVSAKLTLPAIVAMNKAVSVDKESAASVAKKFLQANGLL
jgi:osmoprotectant transport system substrate-binding protein